MKLAFREFGAGQPLIILHGLFGQSDNWNTLAKQFAEQGFHVFTLDQRNHGLSPHSDDWNYAVMADDLKEFIDDHSLQKPILLGHSMGAKTVLFFESSYPGIAGKIILADMAARVYPPHHADVFKALHAVDFDKVKTRKEAEAVMNEHIQDFGTKQFLLKNIYWKDSDANLMAWRFNLDAITKNYKTIMVSAPDFVSSVPALIIKGGNSNYIQAADVEDYKKRFPDSTFE
ncbi:MAG: alpha/beta fold hydrolase, partial [Bacteroidia bacterium]|nr:alpha/beta fold hydrolase [Bacteroidia bacterium]